MIQYVEAKSILSKLKSPDNFFGIAYNMNLYRGCQHGCIYCDTRSECYGIHDISKIAVKQNAPELLEKELYSRKTKATIGTGSMNDPYMPVEKELGLTRKALQIIASYKFPVHIITKSDLVLRDYDILQEISKKYTAVSFTITCNDNLSKTIEPKASPTSARFKAIEFLAKKGIYTGITLMPLLPFINDTKENLTFILHKAKDSGASYIIPMLGVTLRKGSRDYFYKALDGTFPGIKDKYQTIFGDRYECLSPNYKDLNKILYETSEVLKIPLKMNFYSPPSDKQQSLF